MFGLCVYIYIDFDGPPDQDISDLASIVELFQPPGDNISYVSAPVLMPIRGGLWLVFLK